MTDLDDEVNYPQAAYIPRRIGMSRKQYFCVNLSKFITEIIGTASVTIFYLILGDQNNGLFLVFWIITIFGIKISGSHFNPIVTLIQMFRSGEAALETRMLGVIYIFG